MEEREEQKMEKNDEEPEREDGGSREPVVLNVRDWLRLRRGLSMATGSWRKVKRTSVECGEGGDDGDVR